MIKHIVLLKMKSEYTDEQRASAGQKCKSLLENLNGKIIGLIKIEVGLDFSCTAASSDLVIYSEFSDLDALNRYYVDLEHLKAKAYIDQLWISRSVADYEIL